MYVAMGFGGSWTINDAISANMAEFMSAFAEGLRLPPEANVAGQCGTAAVLLLQVGYWFATWTRAQTGSRIGPANYENCVTLMQLTSLAVLWVLAAGWHCLAWGEAINVLGGAAISSVIGTLEFVCLMPMVLLFCKESLISAVMAGSAMGSLVDGLLGLLQGSVGAAALTPSVFFGILALLQTASLLAWLIILRKRIGFRISQSPQGADASST